MCTAVSGLPSLGTSGSPQRMQSPWSSAGVIGLSFVMDCDKLGRSFDRSQPTRKLFAMLLQAVLHDERAVSERRRASIM